jgi:hypothetical protein
MGRPHSPATAATWGRHLLNPETSPALRRCLFRLVTTNESTKVFWLYESCFIRSKYLCTYWCQIKHSSHTVFPSIEKMLSNDRSNAEGEAPATNSQKCRLRPVCASKRIFFQTYFFLRLVVRTLCLGSL